eukprot:m.197043 g.197043  ORF g.197043 m.197043 type:complete len:262 (+) comp19977_c0_seq1:269-1054(+)
MALCRAVLHHSAGLPPLRGRAAPTPTAACCVRCARHPSLPRRTHVVRRVRRPQTTSAESAPGAAALPEAMQLKINGVLTPSEQVILTQALNRAAAQGAQAAASAAENGPISRPSILQLRRYFLQGMLPMIGFGFVDNAIMLTAGDAIDQTLGATLAISTLAAAGLGNMVSDVMGLGLSSYVEAFATKVGIPSPEMSIRQMGLPVARWTMLAASVVGISIGCLLGMMPLLFLTNEPPEQRALRVAAAGKTAQVLKQGTEKEQ